LEWNANILQSDALRVERILHVNGRKPLPMLLKNGTKRIKRDIATIQSFMETTAEVGKLPAVP